MTNYKPGDQKKSMDRMLRVDHAGEYGAVRIYEGQIAAAKANPLKDPEAQQRYLDELTEMLGHEQQHLAYFEKTLPEYKVRPSVLIPLWHQLGFMLGYATGRIGKPAAMACTVAVETEIADHYQEQLDTMDEASEKPLYDKIHQFREEEIEHHDHALTAGAEAAPAYPLLNQFIRQTSKLAIKLSERL